MKAVVTLRLRVRHEDLHRSTNISVISQELLEQTVYAINRISHRR